MPISGIKIPKWNQRVLLFGMGLLFIIVIGAFAGLFSGATINGHATLSKSIIPRSNSNYDVTEDVTIRVSASIAGGEDEYYRASLTLFKVTFWKTGHAATTLYEKTWAGSANELSEVYQVNKGRLSAGQYNVRLQVETSAEVMGALAMGTTFYVSTEPQIQIFSPTTNELLEITTIGRGVSVILPINFNIIEGSNPLASIKAKTDSNSEWSASNFQQVTYKPSIQLKATAAEDGMTTNHYLYITVKDSIGLTITKNVAFQVKWTYGAEGGGFEAPSFTWLLTLIGFVGIAIHQKRRDRYE